MLGDSHWLSERPGGGPQGKLIGGAQALYWEKPSPDQLGGFTPEDYASPEQRRTGIYYDLELKDWFFDLWEENWPPLQLYIQLQTQWRVGMAGPYGLDYNVVFHELDRKGLDGEAYDDMLAAMRVVEEVALKALTKPK
jgi:hypothetical protein